MLVIKGQHVYLAGKARELLPVCVVSDCRRCKVRRRTFGLGKHSNLDSESTGRRNHHAG